MSVTVDDERGRAGVAQHVSQLRAAQPGVDRALDGTEADQREGGDDDLGIVGREVAHDIAALDAGRGQPGGTALGGVDELLPRRRRAVEVEHDPVRDAVRVWASTTDHRSCAVTAPAVPPHHLEPGKGHLVGHGVEHDARRVAHLHLSGLHPGQRAHQPDSLVQLDDRHAVGHVVLPRVVVEGDVHPREAPHASRAGSIDPLDVLRPAGRAGPPGVEERGAAVLATRQRQPALGGRLPVRRGHLVAERRERLGVVRARPGAHRPLARNIVLNVDSTPPLPVTAATRAPSTWRGPASPRSWRTASRKWKTPPA